MERVIKELRREIEADIDAFAEGSQVIEERRARRQLRNDWSDIFPFYRFT